MALILVVDDEPHILRLVSFSLGKAGHEVLEAPDGMTALKVAEERRPHLILMDVMMPLMTGIETLDRLRENAVTCGIPVVMLSARSQSYEQQEGIEHGALRYLCKPFTPSDLVESVGEVLGSLEGAGQ